jgi:hypothetical protein
MHPFSADLQALLAAGDVGWRIEDLDFVEVAAGGHRLLLCVVVDRDTKTRP